MLRAAWHTACARHVRPEPGERSMSNFFRTIFAGYGAYKLGGGCISTVLIFVVLYWLLGTVC